MENMENILPEAVIESKKNGTKIIKIYSSDENESVFYFRKPSKAEYKMNLDKIISGQMSAEKAFSMVSHMENSVKKLIVYPDVGELSVFLDNNLSCIADFYGKLFGETEKKLDFLSIEI